MLKTKWSYTQYAVLQLIRPYIRVMPEGQIFGWSVKGWPSGDVLMPKVFASGSLPKPTPLQIHTYLYNHFLLCIYSSIDGLPKSLKPLICKRNKYDYSDLSRLKKVAMFIFQFLDNQLCKITIKNTFDSRMDMKYFIVQM